MKIRNIVMLLAACLPLLAGCSADQPAPSAVKMTSDSSCEASSAPFDAESYSAEPFSANLQYLGEQDLTKTAAYEIYIKNYAPDANGSVIKWEHVSPRRLADRLTERISSDLSPDLCDKLDNSLPYLSQKNLYEDLTEYIDKTAPQWEEYNFLSDGSAMGRYFYPTSITISPNVLLYSKSAVSSRGAADPLTQWRNGKWTMEDLRAVLKNTARAIGGWSTAENILASNGTELFTVDQNGKISSNLHSEEFKESAEFVSKNCENALSSGNGYFLQKGIESLQSGEQLFLSITEDELEEIRRDYPESDFEIVPFPREDGSGVQYYYTLCEGYLVPKRAKNIRGAASFINCSRIAAYSSETEYKYLTEQDIRTLSAIRRANTSQLVFDTNRCLNSEANSASSRIIFAMYSEDANAAPLEELLKSLEVPIEKAVAEHNQSAE